MAYRVENGQLRDGIECKLVVAVPGPDVHIRRALPTCRHRDGDRVRECRVKHGERILHARRWAEAIANPTQPVLVLRPERDADSLSCDGKDVTRRDGNGTGNGRCGRLEIRRPDTGECLGNRTDAHSTRHRPGGAVDRRVEEIDRKSTRLNSSHITIYTLSLHDALPILSFAPNVMRTLSPVTARTSPGGTVMVPATVGAGGWKFADQIPESVSGIGPTRTLHVTVPAALSIGVWKRSPCKSQSPNVSRMVVAPTLPVSGAVPVLSMVAPGQVQPTCWWTVPERLASEREMVSVP